MDDNIYIYVCVYNVNRQGKIFILNIIEKSSCASNRKMRQLYVFTINLALNKKIEAANEERMHHTCISSTSSVFISSG